jgi:alanine dehydrogenase
VTYLTLVDALAAAYWALVHRRTRVGRGTMKAVERYDLVILGGGAAGINALKTAVTLAARVALVDRGPLGGTCVNWG